MQERARSVFRDDTPTPRGVETTPELPSIQTPPTIENVESSATREPQIDHSLPVVGLEHRVSIHFSWRLDNRPLKGLVPEIQNINDPSRKNWFWQLLIAQVDDFVDEWAASRGLKGIKAPMPVSYEVTLAPGPRKNLPPMDVSTHAQWEQLLAELRKQFHETQSFKKRSGEDVYIECSYVTGSRDEEGTEGSPRKTAKPRKQSKAQPDKVRKISLQDDKNRTKIAHKGKQQVSDFVVDSVELSSTDSSDNDDGKVDDTPRGRATVTKSQLDQKRKKDLQSTSQELKRQELFALHHCTEPKCANFGTCCYKMKNGNHHRINLTKQSEWAAEILKENATIQHPPVEWIASFLNGEELMERGNRKKSGKAVQTPPIKTEEVATFQNSHHFQTRRRILADHQYIVGGCLAIAFVVLGFFVRLVLVASFV